MLRITRQDECLVVEGRVAGAWVQELSRAAEELIERAPAPRLDLSGVSYVDGDGARMLRRLEGRLEIRASGFVHEILRRGM